MLVCINTKNDLAMEKLKDISPEDVVDVSALKEDQPNEGNTNRYCSR